jgi:hypothetical protein
VSSAYCRIGKFPLKSSHRGCLRTPFCQALLIIDCNKSIASTNRRGERGSPYIIPLLQLNDFLGTPFRITKELGVLRMF